jgi:uncharacterized protein (PEP-CTERM system associated)
MVKFSTAAMRHRPAPRRRTRQLSWSARPAVIRTCAACLLALGLPTIADAQFPDTSLAPYPAPFEAPAPYPSVGGGGAFAPSPYAPPSPFAPPAPTQGGAAPAGAAPQGPAPGPARRWSVTPTINLGEAFDDNVFQTHTGRQADAITSIAPGLYIVGDTARLQAALQYAPVIGIYASHSELNSVEQNLNAAAHATLLEDTLFLDLRGVAQVQPTFGGLPIGAGGVLGAPGFGGLGSIGQPPGAGGVGTLLINKQTQTQSYSFYAAPYAVHRFGSAGTLQVGYAISQSGQNAGSGGQPGTLTPGSSNVLTQEEVLQFASGSALGRFQDVVLLEGNQYSGNGVAQNAYGYVGTNRLAYAVTHHFAVFGELGAEDIQFGGEPATRISDAVWAGGIEFDPREDAHLILGYGHRYGFNSLLFDAAYAVTARTTIFGTYSSGLGTDLLQFQGLVAGSTIDVLGQTVDRQTETPIFLNNSALSVQGNASLYRIKSFTAGVTTTLTRDTLQLAFAADEQSAIATTLAALPGSNRAVTASLTWRHDLTPLLSSIVFLGIGEQNQPGQTATGQLTTISEHDDFAAAQLTLRYLLSETLTGYAQYTYFERSSNIPDRNFNQNVFLVGLSKQF